MAVCQPRLPASSRNLAVAASLSNTAGAKMRKGTGWRHVVATLGVDHQLGDPGGPCPEGLRGERIYEFANERSSVHQMQLAIIFLLCRDVK